MKWRKIRFSRLTNAGRDTYIRKKDLSARLCLVAPRASFNVRIANDEAHLQTERLEAQETAWVPRPDVLETGPTGSVAPPCERPEETIRLTGSPGKGLLLRLETLKRRAEFDRLRRGRKWAGRAFMLQGTARAGADIAGPRFGFVIASKSLRPKTAGATSKRPGAVLRNRAKRRLKEAVRLLAADHAMPNHDYVIIGRYEALHQHFSDLLEDLQFAFSKVNRPPTAHSGTSRKPNEPPKPVRQGRKNIQELGSARTPASGLGQTHDG